MNTGRPSREDAVLAVVTGGWTAGFLVGETPAVYVVPPVAAFGVLLLDRRPVAGSLVVAAAQLASTLLGVDPGSPAGLVSLMLALYAVGRRAGEVTGLLVLALYLLVVLAADFSAGSALFGGFLLGGTWAFGRTVRRRTEAAADAAATAARLHATDPAQVAARVVAEERVRLAEETVTVVRDAVADMRRHAEAAEPRLDPERIAAIQTRGAGAVAELRRLLGLLREQPDIEPPPPPAGSRVAVGDVALVGLVVALAVLETTLLPGPQWSAPGFGLVLVLAGSLAIRRTHLAAACAVATGATAVSLLTDTPMQHGFADTTALVLLSWSVGGSVLRRDWFAGTALALVTLVTMAREALDGVALTAAIFVLPAFAGRAWGERGREERAAERSADALQEHIDRQVAAAVTHERLRIARELHDVASHAVGVMVLQAGAASALRVPDPPAARAALDVVRASGADALAELAVLQDVLRAGALGATTSWPVPSVDLGPALRELASRMRATGLDVDLRLASVPEDPGACATLYRVVQEALTNAAKHAPGARVDVTVRRDANTMVVEIHDDGRGSDEAGEAGFGLVGLAERVRAHGGELSAGAHPGGGFAVLARVPLSPAEREVAR